LAQKDDHCADEVLMSRYFFNLNRMGKILLDAEGTELASIADVREEAALAARNDHGNPENGSTSADGRQH
jgi:hypothetical protein